MGLVPFILQVVVLALMLSKHLLFNVLDEFVYIAYWVSSALLTAQLCTPKNDIGKVRERYRCGRLSTVDLPIRGACFE